MFISATTVVSEEILLYHPHVETFVNESFLMKMIMLWFPTSRTKLLSLILYVKLQNSLLLSLVMSKTMASCSARHTRKATFLVYYLVFDARK
mmetsp:Transcript_33334/g.76963  ORF Transcript_33334/g.76963 Transcript_33334/m.76963 type:complete len:92 (-) Transcript_33334:167-442(-)